MYIAKPAKNDREVIAFLETFGFGTCLLGECLQRLWAAMDVEPGRSNALLALRFLAGFLALDVNMHCQKGSVGLLSPGWRCMSSLALGVALRVSFWRWM